jgi:hypothetical protein
MQEWEYKTIVRSRTMKGDKDGFWYPQDWNAPYYDMDPILQQLGKEGWELVAISPRSGYGSSLNMYAGGSGGGPIISGVTTQELWVFKRPKS